MVDKVSWPVLSPLRLSLIKLSKSYLHMDGQGGVNALHNIDLDINSNEFVAITGISGSGKSTLLHILGCIDSPTVGSYRINQVNPAESSSDDRALLRRKTFGYVFQNFSLLPDLTAEQNVLLPAAYSDVVSHDSRRLARKLLELLSLGNRLHHFPAELSGGQQQRVAIARALMNGGTVILADEPTASLDTEMSTEIMAVLAGLHAAGRTVIVSTHDPAVAVFAHRVITLKDGMIISDVRQEPAVPSEALLPILNTIPTTLSRTDFLSLKRGIDALHFSLHQLKANFLRTVLTILGIIIGAAAFVTMVGIGEGQKQSIVARMTKMGTDILFVVPFSRGDSSAPILLSIDDANTIIHIPNVSAVAPEISGNLVYRFGNKDYQVPTIATMPSYFKIKHRDILIGTLFTEMDSKLLQPVAVIGSSTARSLFGNEGLAIGKYVVANNVLLQVIGVLMPHGAEENANDADNIVFVPFDTGRRRIIGRDGVSILDIQVKPPESISLVQHQIEETLFKQRQQANFQVHNMAAIIKAANETRDSLTWLLAAIACLSLLVGGIGIMNVMLMSGLERAREIGIRVACGARERDIRRLFMAEAFVLSAIGGTIGCLLGVGFTIVLNMFGIPSLLSLSSCALALIFSVAVGIVFGYWPAKRAANCQPIEVIGR